MTPDHDNYGVGCCDLCGEFSTHLHEGACPGCNDKYEPVYTDEAYCCEAVGYEAADVKRVRETG